jgi:replicative DNA helicase
VFETISELYNLKQEIDLQIVYTSLKKKISDDSILDLTEITNCLSFNNINFYVNKLKDLDERIKLKDKLVNDFLRVDDLNFDTKSLKADISSEIERMIKAEAKGSSIDQVTYEFIDFLEKCMTTKNEDMHYGIPTVDRHTGGISDGQLITIGAKSGVGK